MTVPVPGSLTYSYNEDGITTVFPYPVRFLEPQELSVSREVNGVKSRLTFNVDYTVSGAGQPSGGSIIRAAATNGGKIIIERDTAWKQIVDLNDKARNPADAVELQLDRLTMAGQDSTHRIALVEEKTTAIDEAVARSESAKNAAEAAAGAATEAQLAAESAAGANLSNADSRAAAIATNIPGPVNYVRTAGYASAGDGGGALYRRVASEPAHAGKFQSADGAWWEIASEVYSPKKFGIHVAPDDASTDLQRALDAAAERGTAVRLPPGELWAKDITLTAPLFGVPGASTIKLLSGATRLFTGASGTGPLTLADLIVDGNGETVRALLSEQNSRVRIRDIEWQNWGGYCVDFLQGTRDVAVKGGSFRDIGGENCLVFRGFYNRALSIHFGDIYAHAVRFGRFNSDIDIDSGLYSLVDGCVMEDVGNDAVLCELDSRWVKVTGNACRNIRSLIKVQSSDSAGPASRMIVANNVVNNQIPASSDGTSLGACIKAEAGVIGLIAHGNIIRSFERGIQMGSDSSAHDNNLEAITGRAILALGADNNAHHNRILSHTGDYAIYGQGSSNRLNANFNIINTTGTGIRIEAPRSKVMFNDIAALTGIQATSGASSSQVGGNDLSRVSGTKFQDAATGTISSPTNIIA